MLRDIRDALRQWARTPVMTTVVLLSQGTSIAESTPFGFGAGHVQFSFDGDPLDGAPIELNRVSDGYFRTLGIPFRAGRDFDAMGREPRESAIVNEAFAARYLSGATPIGRTMRLSMRNHKQVEIVGVVANSRHTSLRDPVAPVVYLPLLFDDPSWMEIDIRSQLPESQVHAAVLDIMAQAAPGASVEFRSIESGINDAAARDRVIAWLAGGFAVLALLLSAIGLYGVMSHQVNRRRQEFGVRVAIGAAPGSVLRMILRQAAWIVGVGVVVGLLVGLGSGRLIAAMLYDVTPADPVAIALTIVFLASVTLLAGFIPARRASRVDPMSALRED